MRQHQNELDAHQVQVLVVTFEKPEVARRYGEHLGLEWPILIDASRDLYHAYGMLRGSSWAVLGPRNWWQYSKLLASGRRLKKPTGDIYQLGGDVLVDPTGVVRLHHVGEGPADRPPVSQLLKVVRSA